MSGYHYLKHFIHVLVVLCADDDGGNNDAQKIDPKALEAMFTEINTYYEDAGLHFTFNRHIDIAMEKNSELNQDFTVPSTADLKSKNPPMTDSEIQNSINKHNNTRAEYAKQREGHLVLFYRHGTSLKFDKVKGEWSVERGISAWSGGGAEFVVLKWYVDAKNGAHEMGHYFHLLHTFFDDTQLSTADEEKFPKPHENPSDHAGRRELLTEKVQNKIRDYVSAGNPIEHGHHALDADWPDIRDTPPDPGEDFFYYHGHRNDNHGITVVVKIPLGWTSIKRAYTLFPDKSNLMSYFSTDPLHFSGQQLDQMRRSVTEEVPPSGLLSRHHLISRPIPPQAYRTLSSGTWEPGWTHFVPYTLLGKPYLIAYSLFSREFHFDRLNEDGSGTTILDEGHWAFWTHVETFTTSQGRYLLVYNGFTGEVRFDKIRPDGSGSDNVWESKWAKAWSHIVPIGHKGMVRDHLIVYKQSTGEVRIDRFNNNAKGTINLWEGKWAKDWSSIMPYHYNLWKKSWRFLVYNKFTGVVRFDKLDDPANGSSNLDEMDWAKGWTHFMPYPVTLNDSLLASSARFLAYNEATGDIHFDRISDAGFQIVRYGKWEEGWSSLIPTFLTKEAHGNQGFITYNKDSGKVNFNRLG